MGQHEIRFPARSLESEAGVGQGFEPEAGDPLQPRDGPDLVIVLGRHLAADQQRVIRLYLDLGSNLA